MKDEKSVTKEEDLEIVEIAEFKINDTRKQKLRQKEQEKIKRQSLYGILSLYAVGFLAAVLICMFAFRLPVAVVCVILVLETAIAVCMYEASAGIHLLEIVIGIVAGVIYGRLLLMIVGTLIYLGAVIALRGIRSLNLGTDRG